MSVFSFNINPLIIFRFMLRKNIHLPLQCSLRGKLCNCNCKRSHGEEFYQRVNVTLPFPNRILNENLVKDPNNPVTVKKLFVAGMFSGDCLHVTLKWLFWDGTEKTFHSNCFQVWDSPKKFLLHSNFLFLNTGLRKCQIT